MKRFLALLCVAACARGVAGPAGARGEPGAVGAKGDPGAPGPPGPVVSVYDAAGNRAGTLVCVQVAGSTSYPIIRDDLGYIWVYLDAFGSLPAQDVLLFASADCSGDAYATQVNVAGLVVRHAQALYAVGAASAPLTVRSYRDSA